MDGSPTVANPYHYADNDPLNRVDPTGLRGTDADHRCIKGITGTSEITGLTPSPGSGRLDLPGPGGVIGSGPIIVLPGQKAGGGSVGLGGGPGVCLKPPPGGTKVDPRLAAAAIVAAAAMLASQWFAEINNPGEDGRGSDECSPSQTGGDGGGVTSSDLYAVGREGGPPFPRGRMPDLEVDNGEVCPEAKDENGNPRGLSTFAKQEDLAKFVTGPIWRLPAGSTIPPELAVVKDAPLSHHTIYPTRRMSYVALKSIYIGLGWIPAGHTKDYD